VGNEAGFGERCCGAVQAGGADGRDAECAFAGETEAAIILGDVRPATDSCESGILAGF
jgi:hypothetical protein